MRKRFTKIISTSVAGILALSLSCLAACSDSTVTLSKDDSSKGKALDGTNGGFVVETEDYAYFINGIASNEEVVDKGVRGTLQRIKKSDVAEHKYTGGSETVVPDVIYSGNHSAGIYIYDGYLYYTTPSTSKDIDGNVLYDKLDFKRTKLDGTDTSDSLYRSEELGVEYRIVKPKEDGPVYIMYALNEKLFGEDAARTNIHSLNCSTGENTLLAYGVSEYKFDSEDVENATVYYTMTVPASENPNYSQFNQLFTVRADVTQKSLKYDFSGEEDYDEEKNPIYVNLGTFVYEGVGQRQADRISKNVNYSGILDEGGNIVENLPVDDYTYALQAYRKGVLYYSRSGSTGSPLKSLFVLKDADYTPDNWNPVRANDTANLLLRGSSDISSYTFYDRGDGLDYVISGTSKGLLRSIISGEKVLEEVYISYDYTGTTQLFIRKEGGHDNLYFTQSGGGIYRVAVDGTTDDYRLWSEDETVPYSPVQILDISYESSWYGPEFVGDTLLYPSKDKGYSDRNYIMACDLTVEKDGVRTMMTNKELREYKEQYDAIETKIKSFDDVTGGDGTTKLYENLSPALRYAFHTRDEGYLEELINAMDEFGEGNETYKQASVDVYHDFFKAANDWEKDADDNAYVTRKLNGEDVYSYMRDYYYAVIGPVSEADAQEIKDLVKVEVSLPEYPIDERTWWEKTSSGEKAGFIIGMCACGLIVLGGLAVLGYLIFKKVKPAADDGKPKRRSHVDITDDKNVDVYGDTVN